MLFCCMFAFCRAAFEKAIEGIPTLARAAAISNVCIYALICCFLEFYCVLCFGSFLQVYLYKKRYSGLNQSVSMEKFMLGSYFAYVAFYPVILSSNTFTFLSFFVIPLTFRTRLYTGEIWSFKFKCLTGI